MYRRRQERRKRILQKIIRWHPVILLLIGVFIWATQATLIGYLGGKVDNFFMRVCDVWQAIPGQLLAIVISTTLGAGFMNTILAMSIGGIPMSIRSTRAMCLKEREMEYLEAAQSYNCSKAKIMFKHMLPNIISPTIVGTTMSGNWLWMWKRSPMVSNPTMPYCFMTSTAAVPTKMP